MCTDAASQLTDTTLSPVSSRDYPEQTKSNQTTHFTSSSSPHPSSSSAPKTIDTKAEAAPYVGSEQGFAGGMRILLTTELKLQRIFSYAFQTVQKIQVKAFYQSVWMLLMLFFPLFILLFQERLQSSPQPVPFSFLQQSSLSILRREWFSIWKYYK